MVDQSHKRPDVARTKRRPQRKIFGSHYHAPACGRPRVSKSRVSAGEEGADDLAPIQKNIQTTGGHLPRTTIWRFQNHTAAPRRSVSRCQEFSPPHRGSTIAPSRAAAVRHLLYRTTTS